MTNPTFVTEPVSILIAKADAEGNEVWRRVVEGDTYSVASAMCVNPDGSFVVAGSTRAEQSEDDALLMITFNPDGSERWRRRFSRGNGAGARDIIRCADGGYALAGFTLAPEPLIDDLYVVKTDADGHVQWEYTGGDTIGFSDLRYAESIVETRDGGFAIAGHAFGTLFAAKLNANGESVWVRAAPGAPYADGYDIVEAEDGSLVAAGNSYTRNLGGVPVCIRAYAVRFSEAGDVRWTGRLDGGHGWDNANALVQDRDGNFVMAGGGSGSRIYLIKTDAGREIEARREGSVTGR